jgi:hypothetical protein
MQDTIPAMLSEGEYVIKKDAVDALGVPLLNQLNTINDPQAVNGHSAIDDLIAIGTMNQVAPSRKGVLGVRDEEAILRANAEKLPQQLKYLELMKSRYPDSSSYQDWKQMRIDDGSVMNMDDMQKALQMMMQIREEKKPIKGYEYGGVVERESLQDLYDIYGEAPISQYEQRLEDVYDASGDIGQATEAFKARLGGAQEAGESSMAQLFSKYGGDTGGFGAKGQQLSSLMGETRGAYESGLEKSYQGYQSDLSGIYEGAKTDVFGALGALGEYGGLTNSSISEYGAAGDGYHGDTSGGMLGGTSPDSYDSPDSPEFGETKIENGMTYRWTGSDWVDINTWITGDYQNG